MVNYNDIENDLIKVTKGILNSVSKEGIWGSQDHTDWGPIITVLTIDYLLSCQMDIGEEWTVNTSNESFNCSIEKCLKYLNEQINSDGSFGADFWDVCKLGELILKYNLKDYFDNYSLLEIYISSFLAEDKLSSDATDWSGVGMYVAALDYLVLAGDLKKVQALYDTIIIQVHPEGFFFGKKNKLNSYIIHPIWHTAQLIRFMCKNKTYFNQEIYNKVFDWMCNVQGNNGEFEYFNIFTYYYTCYAIIAFSYYKKNDFYINKALNYIHDSISPNGIVGDSGGTIMTALAFGDLLDKDNLNSVLQHSMYEHQIILTDVLLNYKDRIRELETELLNYKDKEDSTELRFSKKDVWKFGVLLTVFGIFVTVVPAIIPLIIFFLEQK